MTIQWFPGHMATAIRKIKEAASQIDVVIEVLDARAPIASRNPVLETMLSQKPRLVILNKADLCDPRILPLWLAQFKATNSLALPVTAISGNGSKKIEKAVLSLLARNNAYKTRIRAAVLGIPNVGKSTLINHLIGRKITVAANKPGLTKNQTWRPAGKHILLLDTPGILWPKFKNQDIAKKLAAINGIKAEQFDSEEIAYYLCDFLMAHYPSLINQRFKLDEEFAEATTIFEAIGKRQGYFRSGNELDITRVYDTVIREFRSGKLGRISLEKPDA